MISSPSFAGDVHSPEGAYQVPRGPFASKRSLQDRGRPLCIRRIRLSQDQGHGRASCSGQFGYFFTADLCESHLRRKAQAAVDGIPGSTLSDYICIMCRLSEESGSK